MSIPVVIFASFVSFRVLRSPRPCTPVCAPCAERFSSPVSPVSPYTWAFSCHTPTSLVYRAPLLLDRDTQSS